jgi:hypothetical protein
MCPQVELLEQLLGTPLGELGVHAPEAGDEGQVLDRGELVVKERLVGTQAIIRFAAIGSASASTPKISMLPASGFKSPTTMRSVVVLPAPLGPSRP